MERVKSLHHSNQLALSAVNVWGLVFFLGLRDFVCFLQRFLSALAVSEMLFLSLSASLFSEVLRKMYSWGWDLLQHFVHAEAEVPSGPFTHGPGVCLSGCHRTRHFWDLHVASNCSKDPL